MLRPPELLSCDFTCGHQHVVRPPSSAPCRCWSRRASRRCRPATRFLLRGRQALAAIEQGEAFGLRQNNLDQRFRGLEVVPRATTCFSRLGDRERAMALVASWESQVAADRRPTRPPWRTVRPPPAARTAHLRLFVGNHDFSQEAVVGSKRRVPGSGRPKSTAQGSSPGLVVRFLPGMRLL